jgi:hypothetical protein
VLAFRCKNCGYLCHGEVAGQNSLPHACTVCGCGVRFTETGLKVHQRDNWEVLADCTPERLAELGVTAEQIERYVPDHGKLNAENVERAKSAHSQLTAKESHWSANKDTLVSEFKSKLAELKALESVDLTTVDAGEVADKQNQKAQLKQELERIRCTEWTQRDTAHKAEVEKELARGCAAPNRAPKSVFASAMDGTEHDGKSEGSVS